MNAGEYNTLVDLYADGLYRFILKSMRDEEASQDVVQDTFEKLWVRRDEVAAEKGKAWLFSTAYHGMIDQLRRSSRISKLEEAHELLFAAPDTEFTGTAELLDEALNTLPEIQRSVVLLRDYEGYTYQEIGELTSLSESQVKVYIHRARQTLRTYLEKMQNYHHVTEPN